MKMEQQETLELTDEQRKAGQDDWTLIPEMQPLKKVGRPKYWTDDKLRAMAVDIVEWFNEDDERLFLCEYAADKGYAESQLYKWEQDCPEFKVALGKCRTIEKVRLAKRLVRGIGSPRGVEFCLKNVSDWRDRTEVSTDVTIRAQSVPVEELPAGERAIEIKRLVENAAKVAELEGR